ncbi:MAG: ABC transporter permease [Clostridia bacterium]|nr:ABC transporter permease [Clostridia bacterium]
MWRYVVKRLITTFFLLFAITFIVYTIMELTPGDPVMIKLGTQASSQELYETTKHEMGLDQPFLTRYFKYVYNALLRLHLGVSYKGRDVMTEILSRAPRTLLISSCSILLASVVGIVLGVVAAINHGTWKDNTTMLAALLGVSMPDFWFGQMLSIVFALQLRWLPPSGFYGPQYLVLPVITCSLGTLASIARMTRSSMLEVIRQDYITTARAKGQSERNIIIHHALKNAMIPIITVIGTSVSYMMGGAMVAETVFSVGGMGTLMMDSITNLDHPMVLGGVLCMSAFSCVFVLLTDIAYAFVDPRIRAQYQSAPRRKKAGESA